MRTLPAHTARRHAPALGGLLLLLTLLVPRVAAAGEVAEADRTETRRSGEQRTDELVTKHGRQIGGIKRSIQTLRESVKRLKERVGIVEMTTEQHDQRLANTDLRVEAIGQRAAETERRVTEVEGGVSAMFQLLTDPVALTEHVEASKREAQWIQLERVPHWTFAEIPLHAKDGAGGPAEGRILRLGRP